MLNFLKLLPEKQCHVIETPPPGNKPLDITSAFGLVKTPLTATLEEIEQGVVAGALDDSDWHQRVAPHLGLKIPPIGTNNKTRDLVKNAQQVCI